nr:11319_t:CDS:2 [Entrophospora candida]
MSSGARQKRGKKNQREDFYELPQNKLCKKLEGDDENYFDINELNNELEISTDTDEELFSFIKENFYKLRNEEKGHYS